MHPSLLLPLLIFLASNVFSQPNPRHLEEVAYDKIRDMLLVFGGIEITKEGWSEPAMVYEWDGAVWKRFDISGPCGRRGHGWVYDENSKETILIGGVTKGKVHEDSAVFDVWSWNGNNWKLLETDCPVKEPEAVYDPVNKRLLVYGETNNKNQLNKNVSRVFELWEFKNARWKKLSTGGPDITASRILSFAINRNRLVIPVFEEKIMLVWEWTGKEWIKEIFENDCPSYRTKFALAYDAIEKKTVLFGGLSGNRKQLADFWKWNGKKWERVEIKDGPSVRNSAHFTFGNDQLFLYGGSVPKSAPQEGIETCNELWSWKNAEWKLIK